MNQAEYQQYLNSGWWKHYKHLNKENKCEKCGFKHELDLHHRNYDNIGREKESDTITLCRRCHNDLHYEQQRAGVVSEIVIRRNYNISEREYKEYVLSTCRKSGRKNSIEQAHPNQTQIDRADKPIRRMRGWPGQEPKTQRCDGCRLSRN